MTMLFIDAKDLQQFLPVTVDYSPEHLAPYFEQSSRVVKELLSESFYEWLYQRTENYRTQPDTNPKPSKQEKQLWDKARQVIALLAFRRQVLFSQAQISGRGVKIRNAENEENATQGQLNDIRQQAWEMAYEQLEVLKELLLQHADLFSVYQQSQAYYQLKTAFVPTAQVLSNCIGQVVSPAAFAHFQVDVEDIEERAKLYVQDFYFKLLKTKRLANSLNEVEATLWEKVAKAFAFELYAQGLRDYPVALTEQGLVIREVKGNYFKPMPPSKVEQMIEKASRKAEVHWKRAEDWMKANRMTFFHYKEPEKVEQHHERKSFFPGI